MKQLDSNLISGAYACVQWLAYNKRRAVAGEKKMKFASK